MVRLAAQAFAVIRKAIDQEGLVALGRIVFTSREHVIGMKPRDKGLLGVTLRYPYAISTTSPTKRSLRTCSIWRGTSSRARPPHFHPGKFEDRYEEVLKDLLKKQERCEADRKTAAGEPSKVVSLMDAICRSAQGEAAGAQGRGR
jgi:DNA end-binding protein Ku